MNLPDLIAICGPGAVSAAPEQRLVYSHDASRIAGQCLGVVWPTEARQVAELAAWAGRAGIDLVPRGAGTGLCGGATPQDSVVVDFSAMNRIYELDPLARLARVGPGVVLEILNRTLAGAGLCLPVIPGSHRAATVGGMIATDAAGLRAVRYGAMGRWVERVTLVDGRGRSHELAGERLADVVGREGASGFVVEATLRLAELPGPCEVRLEALQDERQAVRRRDEWLADPGLTALEYLNPYAAAAIGWPALPHLLIERQVATPPADVAQAAALWAARDGLYPVLARAGHPVIEDPRLDAPGLAELLPWLAEQDIPVFGHLGAGIIHPCFRDPGDPRIVELYARVAAAGGAVSGEHGIGLKKQRWTASAWREAAQHLKQVYDPERIINRGKAC
jgi:glycolate oxidase